MGDIYLVSARRTANMLVDFEADRLLALFHFDRTYLSGETAFLDRGACGVRPDTSRESLSDLRPIFRAEGRTVTAENSSGISDGAAAKTAGLMVGRAARHLG